MRRSIARFAALRQWDKVYDMDTANILKQTAYHL